jgi:hypothetical protein
MIPQISGRSLEIGTKLLILFTFLSGTFCTHMTERPEYDRMVRQAMMD